MESPSSKLFLNNELFKLPFKPNWQDQLAVLNEVISQGEDLNVWYSYLVRGLPSDYSEEMAYNERLNVNLPWEYKNTSIDNIIKKWIEPLKSFYTPTRIKIFIQKPGKSLIAHCDKENFRYNFLFRNFLYTKQFHNFFVEDRHEKQNCIALKIPLSENKSSFGNSYIMNEMNSKWQIESDGYYYGFNESKLVHGADAVDFHRGVVFIDGKIDLKQLNMVELSEVKLSYV